MNAIDEVVCVAKMAMVIIRTCRNSCGMEKRKDVIFVMIHIYVTCLKRAHQQTDVVVLGIEEW
jgi:hypothetical protein